MFCLCMKLWIGLYLDLLIKAVKAQGEIVPKQLGSPVTKHRIGPEGRRERKRDGKHDSWKSCVFSHQLWAMASYVCV